MRVLEGIIRCVIYRVGEGVVYEKVSCRRDERVGLYLPPTHVDAFPPHMLPAGVCHTQPTLFFPPTTTDHPRSSWSSWIGTVFDPFLSDRFL